MEKSSIPGNTASATISECHFLYIDRGDIYIIYDMHTCVLSAAQNELGTLKHSLF